MFPAAPINGKPVIIGDNGGPFTIKLDTPDDITNFLPQGGTPAALTKNYVDPTKITVLAGQVLALQLNVSCSAAGVLTPGLGGFVLPSGPAAGKTVAQVLADANKALGAGGLTSYAATISDLNDIVTSINEMFTSNRLGIDQPLKPPGCDYSLGACRLWA